MTHKPDFRIFRCDETEDWDSKITAKAGEMTGVYLFDANRRVHICSFTPIYEMWFVGSFWSNYIEDDKESDAVYQEVSKADQEQEEVRYFDIKESSLKETEKVELRDDEWRQFLYEADDDREAAYKAAVEKIMEDLRCNGYVY